MLKGTLNTKLSIFIIFAPEHKLWSTHWNGKDNKTYANPWHVEQFTMPCPLLIYSQSDYLIQVVDTNSIYLMTNSADPDQFWIYTVCKGGPVTVYLAPPLSSLSPRGQDNPGILAPALGSLPPSRLPPPPPPPPLSRKPDKLNSKRYLFFLYNKL